MFGGDLFDKGDGDIRLSRLLCDLKEAEPNRVFLLCVAGFTSLAGWAVLAVSASFGGRPLLPWSIRVLLLLRAACSCCWCLAAGCS